MKLNKILKYVIYGAIFLVPFIPFIVSGSLFFPFITGKNFAFRILVEIMFGAWAILALRKPEYRPKFSWITVLATAFVLIIGLADITGVNPLKSIWSNFERMEGWVTLLHLLGFLFVTGSMMSRKVWHRFFNVSIGASVLMGFYGLMQMAGKYQIHQGSTRLDATLGNSSYLAVYLLFHIFLTLYMVMKAREQSITKWFYGGAILLQTVILYNTATRGALLGLVGGLFLTSLIIAIFEKEKLLLRKISIGGVIGILLVAGLFFGIKNTSFVKDSPVLSRFANISLTETTTKSRFMVWGMALEGFKEKPVLGWGQENFNYVFNKNYNPKMYDQEQWFDRTHNVFFDWLIAGGLLGLLGYLSLFGALVFYLIRDRNKNFSVTEKAILLGMLAGYFFHNLFVFDHIVSYFLFFAILGFVHSVSVDEKEKDSVVNEKINKIAVPVVLVLAIFSVYFFNYKPILTSNSLLYAIPNYNDGVMRNIENFEKAFSYDTFANQEINEQLMQLASARLTSNIPQEQKQAIVDFAYGEMQKQLVRDPNNARLEIIFASFLAQAGGYQESLNHIARAMELSPNKQTIITLAGTILVNAGEPEKGLEQFKKAFELTPEFNALRLKYAAAAIHAGQNELADELLLDGFGTVLIYDSKIIEAYYKTKQFNKVVDIMEPYILDNPTNLQARLSLSAVYLELGMKTKAKEKIREVIELDPNFKEEGEKYLRDIDLGVAI